MFYLIGLGNPGTEYQKTRHNIGRDFVTLFCQKNDFSDFSFDKKTNALISKGKIAGSLVTAILPNDSMNNSGKSLSYFIKNLKQAENILVIHDDLDMGIGSFKIVFNRGSGGHKGVESISKYLKTEKYPRLKLGISDITVSGKIKKPNSSEKVIKHVLGHFSPKQEEILKKFRLKIFKIIETVIEHDYLVAMNYFN